MSERACVIGAGSSGITAAQVLQERGIPFDCFEKGSRVGGNWCYLNDNGQSSSYESLRINTSRRLMQYAAHPMPEQYPDYPDHRQVQAYFEDFVDRFGLARRITFRTEVTRVAPGAGGDGYDVTLGSGETTRYRWVLVANGHHWDPRWPEPGFAGEFDGEQMHSHDYKTPDVLAGKKVLVLGIGNSACDIAVESSQVADRTLLAMRRGAHVIPKHLFGRPTDVVNRPLARLPLPVQRPLNRLVLRLARGRVEDYGLPTPDHRLLDAHPTISSTLLPSLRAGSIQIKPTIDRLAGSRVQFADGSTEEVDLIVYCTGYRITFPFFDEDFLDAPENRIPLYLRVVEPSHPGLFFIGLIQPLGAIMPLAEQQAHWVADLIEGRAGLPDEAEMRREIAREDQRTRRRYVASPRHTLEVDFWPYRDRLLGERRRGATRTGRPGQPVGATR